MKEMTREEILEKWFNEMFGTGDGCRAQDILLADYYEINPKDFLKLIEITQAEQLKREESVHKKEIEQLEIKLCEKDREIFNLEKQVSESKAEIEKLKNDLNWAREHERNAKQRYEDLCLFYKEKTGELPPPF